MKTYKSFGALAREFEQNLRDIDAGFAVAMNKCAVAVEATAKSEFGHYQNDSANGWEEWAQLKASTQSERVRKGFTENDPLLRTGKLRDSVHHTAGERTFVVGSADPVMLYQELGTQDIPPRAVLAPALHRNIPIILNIVGNTVESAVSGQLRNGI